MEKRGLVNPASQLAHTSVWRFLTQHGLMPAAPAVAVDRRKFVRLMRDAGKKIIRQARSAVAIRVHAKISPS
jgi:hypothetical protein